MIHHVTIRSVTDWAWFQRGVSTRGPRDVSSRYVLPPLPAITTVAGTGVGALPSPEDLTTAQSATASTLRTPSGHPVGLRLKRRVGLFNLARCGQNKG